MSSSFGGSSGSSGQIRFQIVVDDSQVNSKLSSFQSTLGRLNSATQTTSSQFQELSNSTQGVGSAINTASKDLDAINNNFRSMDSSVVSTTKSMGALQNNFKDVQGGLTSTNTLLGRGSQATESFGQKMKSFGGFLKDNALSIGIVGSSVVGLVSSYTQLQKSQLAAQTAQSNAEKAQQRVVKLQEKVNDLIAKGKTGTSDYNIAVKDLAIAQDVAGQKTEKAALAVQIANENMANFVPQFLQDTVTLGAGVAQMATSMKGFGPVIKGLITSLGSAGLAGALTALAGPLAGVVAGVTIGTAVTKTMTQVQGELDKAIGQTTLKLSSWELGILSIKNTFGLLSAEEKKKLDTWNAQDKILGDLTQKAREQIPVWEQLTGALSPDTLTKISQTFKNAGVTIKTDLVTALKDGKITADELSGSVQTLTSTVQDLGGATVEEQLEWAKFQDKLKNTVPDLKAVSQETVNLVNAIASTRTTLRPEFNTMNSMFDELTRTINGSVAKVDFANELKKKMDDALNVATSGLDKIIEAFHKTRKGKLDFEVDTKKAEKKMDQFLGTVGQKLDNGGSEGAKKYVESYAKEADSKMKGAARIQFQPIFDYVEKHKGEDASSWMEGFLKLIGSMDNDTKKAFTQLLYSDKEWKKFGKGSGSNWGDGFTAELEKAFKKARKEANSAMRDIEKVLHLKGGSLGNLDVNIGSKAMGGIITSAASGRMFTTNGPTLTIAGDNPGGKESVAYIPHNNPEPTLTKIDAMFGKRTYAANQPIIIHLHNNTNVDGNELINTRALKKMVKMTVGSDFDKYGSS